MTTLEILEMARDLIRKPENWCKARRHDGQRHCVVGAIEVVDDRPGETPYDHPVVLLLSEMVGKGVHHWNDTHTHAEVLELFNLAIAAEIAKDEAHSRHMAEEQEREQAEDPAAPLVFAGEPVLSSAC